MRLISCKTRGLYKSRGGCLLINIPKHDHTKNCLDRENNKTVEDKTPQKDQPKRE